MVTQSSILACEIPWTEEPRGLPPTSPWGHKEMDTTERLNDSWAKQGMPGWVYFDPPVSLHWASPGWSLSFAFSLLECLIHLFHRYVTALWKQNTPDLTQVATDVSGSQSEVCIRITWRAAFPILWVWGGAENLPFSRAASCWSGEHLLRSTGPQHSTLGGAAVPLGSSALEHGEGRE